MTPHQPEPSGESLSHTKIALDCADLHRHQSHLVLRHPARAGQPHRLQAARRRGRAQRRRRHPGDHRADQGALRPRQAHPRAVRPLARAPRPPRFRHQSQGPAARVHQDRRGAARHAPVQRALHSHHLPRRGAHRRLLRHAPAQGLRLHHHPVPLHPLQPAQFLGGHAAHHVLRRRRVVEPLPRERAQQYRR